MKKVFLFLSCFLIPWIVFAQTSLRFSVVPDGSAAELEKKYSKLAEYLGDELKVNVKFVYMSSYEDVLAALVDKRIDMAYVGGFAFVQVQMMTGNARPIVQREEDRVYVSVVIANQASGIQNISDLKGKIFGFGPLISTSGSLLPRYFFREMGIIPEKDFKRIIYSKRHESTAKAVESGIVEAGVMSGGVWDKMVREKKINLDQVNLIWTSEPYIDNTWIMMERVGAPIVDKVTDAFLKLDHRIPEHKAILNVQGASRYAKSSADSYSNVEQAARRTGLLGCQPWSCDRP